MRVITFGEIMLRLSPAGNYRFLQAESFGATFGGGEANVAVSLAEFGSDAAFVSKIPEHEIGQAAVNSLRRFGVDTSLITRGGERLGIYFLEKGASQRPSKVIYDRAHSAFAKAAAADFDWERIFKNADWFHFTGITPALNDNLAEMCLAAVKAAKKLGVKISCDTNYRSKLWGLEKASAVMTELMQYVDVCITNPGDAKDLFGIISDDKGFDLKNPDNAGAASVAKKLKSTFGLEKVALTLRTNLSASDNDWAAMLYDGESCCTSKKYRMHIVDRVGGGDSFSAGLIYALLNNYSAKSAVEFAAAASCLKHTVEGDFNCVSVAEVESLAGGDGSGRVQR